MYQALANLRNAGFDPSGIIDIGAHDGAFSRGARKIFADAHVMMIEALPQKEGVLKKVVHDIGNAETIICLVGEQNIESVPFWIVDQELRPDLVTTGSSKFKENNNFPMKQIALPQYTLKAIIANTTRTYEFLKIDVQGAELDVIRGIGDTLKNIEVILMEMSLVQYNEQAPLISDALPLLSHLGFVLFDIVEYHRWGNSLMQIDGLFVRPNSKYRRQPPFLG